MHISQIKERVAEEFPDTGFSPPPKSWRTRNRRIWIAEMWEHERQEIKQDEQ